MFSVRSTLIILAFLTIPFAIRLLTSREPYPAVLLPENAYVIRQEQGKVHIEYLSLHAMTEGKENEVNLATFFYPIPSQYAASILENEFGLNDSLNIHSKRIQLLQRSGLFTYHPDNSNKKQTRTWLRSRLMQQGFDPARLKIVVNKAIISTQTGKPITNVILHEHNIQLDQ